MNAQTLPMNGHLLPEELHEIAQVIGASAAVEYAHLAPDARAAVAAYTNELRAEVAERMADALVMVEILEPFAVAETQSLWRVHNPMSPEGQSALYSWLAGLGGSISAGVIGVLLGALMQSPGAALGLGMLGFYGGNIAGARYGAGIPEGLSEADRRQAQNFATLGAAVLPSIGAPIGAYVGATPNPSHRAELHGLRHELSQAKTSKQLKRVERQINALERRSNPKAKRPKVPRKTRIILDDGSHHDVRVVLVTDHFAVHPSVRSAKEVETATKRATFYGVSHRGSGQLVATVRGQEWATKLARELEKISDPGVALPDPTQAAYAIGGRSLERVPYILHVQRQAQKPKSSRGDFPTFSRWKKSAKELDNPPNEADLKSRAAVAAAIGALVGGVVGSVAGLAVVGAAGAVFGLALGGVEGATGGAMMGAIMGIPVGYVVGTVWGAVRQTGQALDTPDARDPITGELPKGYGTARTGAAVGGVFFGPIGAGVGAYLGA